MKKLFLSISFLLLLCGSTSAQCRYSLEELLHHSRDNSTQYSIDSLKLVAARADQLRARSAFFPQVKASSSWLSIQSPLKLIDAEQLSHDFLGKWSPLVIDSKEGQDLLQKINNLGTWDLKNTWLLNVGVVQPLFAGGKIIASNRMADYALEARQWQAQRSQAEAEHHIREAYYQLVALHEKEALLEQYIEMLQQIVKDVAALSEEGYATKGDLLELKMALSKAHQGLNQLQQLLPVASQNLALLAHLPLDASIIPDDNVSSLLAKATDLAISQESNDCNQLLKVSDATNVPSHVNGNSDGSRIRLLELSKKIKHQETLLEQSKMLPQLAFFANYTALYPNPFDAMKKKVGGTWSLGVTLEVPISEIYGGYQARRSAKAQELIAGLEEKELQSKLALERKKAEVDAELAKGTLLSSERLKKDSESNLALARLGYNEGEVSIEKLLRIEADWLQINQSFITALTDLFIKQSALSLSYL